jgi:6-pyruvoyltetrahydropterin/6-carboxytetrahydropterin synthase
VVITLEAPELDERGMVIDFSEIKSVVSRWIDDQLDHRMILHKDDPVVATLQQMGEPLYLLDENPTAENIVRLIYRFTRDHGFPIVEAKLWETPRCFATYGEG